MKRDKPLLVLSLGAGVQSSTLALMAAEGLLLGPDGKPEVPDCAIFADTGCEPPSVYAWLEELERRLPFPVHRVMWAEGLLENIKASIAGGRFAGAPFFTEATDFAKARVEIPAILGDLFADFEIEEVKAPARKGRVREGQLRRQCTNEFKIQPIKRKIRELLGAAPGQKIAHHGILCRQYIGISLDEIERMKPSHDRWIKHEHPLIELRMRRHDCNLWLASRGVHNLPKSACSFCPYRSNAEWRRLKAEEPEAWEQAVMIDRLVRGGVRGTTQALYVHRSMMPLDEAPIDLEENHSLWGEECLGMCGT